MNDIEDDYNRRFNEQELPDDGFDVEGLWGAISETLDEKEADKPGFNRWGIWGIGLLVLLIAGAGLGIYLNSSNSSSLAEKNDATTVEVTKNQPESSSNTNSNPVSDPSATQSEPGDSNAASSSSDEAALAKRDSKTGTNKSINAKVSGENKSQLSNRNKLNENDTDFQNSTVEKASIVNANSTNSKQSKAVSSTRPIEEETALNANTKKNSSATQLPVNSGKKRTAQSSNTEGSGETNKEDKTVVNNDGESIPPNKKDDSNSKTTTESNKNTIANNSNTATEEAKKTLKENNLLSSINLFELNSKLFAFSEMFSASKGSIQPNVKSNSHRDLIWQVGLYAGVNKLVLDFEVPDNSELSQLKNDAETGVWGTSYGLQLGGIWKNKWLFNTGLEYQSAWSKLDFEKTTSEIVLVEDALVTVFLDGNTGNTLRTRMADVNVNVDSTRQVVHHNQYKMLSVPVLLGWQGAQKSFLYGLSAGPVLTFTNSQTGRTIDKESKIINFETDSSVAPLNSFIIGLRVKPFIAYRLTTRMSVQLDASWTTYNNKRSSTADFKVGVQQLNANLGIQYRF